MYKNRLQGFTLIELLVVIAIIGILSAVVLASLSTARNKGSDAAVQSDLATVQVHAEIYYAENSNSYGSNGNAASGTACGDLTNTMFSQTNIKNAMIAADAANGGTGPGSAAVTCYVGDNGASYAASGKLLSPLDSTKPYWCVDSSGRAGAVAADIISADCP